MKPVAGKLDDISYTLGQLKAEVGSVAQSIEANRQIADARHNDNQARLLTIERTLTPLNEKVTKIMPIVDSMQVARLKMSGAISLAGFVLAGIGWALIMVAKELVIWLASVIR